MSFYHEKFCDSVCDEKKISIYLIKNFLFFFFYQNFHFSCRSMANQHRSFDQPIRRRSAFKQSASNSTPTISTDADNDEYGYLAIEDIPPPLPPRNKSFDQPKFTCCNSDKCECYCEL